MSVFFGFTGTPQLAGELGSASLAQRIFGGPPATGTLTTSPAPTANGSVLLAGIARGFWSTDSAPPFDNLGNSFSLVDGHYYSSYPSSFAGIYESLHATGGAGHTFSMTWGDVSGGGDEVTLSAVEVRGVSGIEDISWVERPTASSLTSAPVTTTGPAVLVAWWWGTGGIVPPGESHVAVPGNGFSIIPGATGLVSLSYDGYIQVAAASRIVDAAGTYDVTWTTNNEGAQLYLVALQ